MPTVAPRRKTAAKIPGDHDAHLRLSDTEVNNAIRRTFFFDGLMIARRLYDVNGVGRYRVNWFRDTCDGPIIHETRFLHVSRADDEVVITNMTIGGTAPARKVPS